MKWPAGSGRYVVAHMPGTDLLARTIEVVAEAVFQTSFPST